ncbi:hypothetical protein [Vibrio sp. 10N.261.55.A7]|uniref:hypothetical protein n=1 Tax=Vibrio sp. 10N.261.55.A7 TaxID=1880851 RepID=UPI000C82B207|nr:hypothetical protein [Vibrio sp. 10N.261.55.A7]PMJ90292.1 hypothetical protein BCU12_12420 [Vibrio sp. 10N.261.55.A7]
MSSEQYFRSPREWVKKVVEHLEQALSIRIKTSYQRCAKELTSTQISYLVGEVEPVNSFSNDGRAKHNIELRFLVEVPTSINEFDLEALDASTRVERELSNEFFNVGDDLEESVLVSNLPSRFNPELGVFARTVTFKQTIRMGPIAETAIELAGVESDAVDESVTGS